MSDGARTQEGPGRIVIVKTGEPVPAVRERRGEFADLIQAVIGIAWGGAYQVVDARSEALPAPGAAGGVVITGSAANVPNREPWMLETEAWLRGAVAAGVPTFGICFGHQILAQALGGEVQKNPRGREMGTVRIERTAADPFFDLLPAHFAAQVTHVDTVTRLPAGAVALARSSHDDYQAIRFTASCYGVQFHPEMDADVMGTYVRSRHAILLAEGLDADRILNTVHDTDAGVMVLQGFVRRFVREASGGQGR